MKINNWVLKAGVPLDCFHLRFITADMEVKESKECEGDGKKCEISIYRSFIHFAFCRSLKPLSHSNYTPRYTIRYHAIHTHTHTIHPCHLSVPITRHKYFFIFHLALRFTSLSAFNWKLSTFREKKIEFSSLSNTNFAVFTFFSPSSLFILFSPSPFDIVSSFSCSHILIIIRFWLLHHFLPPPPPPNNFTSIRYRWCSMVLFMYIVYMCYLLRNHSLMDAF